MSMKDFIGMTVSVGEELCEITEIYTAHISNGKGDLGEVTLQRMYCVTFASKVDNCTLPVAYIRENDLKELVS